MPLPCLVHAAVLLAFAVSPAQGLKEDLKLIAFDGSPNDEYGTAVTAMDGVLFVGSPYDDDTSVNGGAVYAHDLESGAFLYKLLPTPGGSDKWFGFSLDSNDSVLICGAPVSDENGTSSGAAYVFDTSTEEPAIQLLADDGDDGDFFGQSVATHSGIAVVGAFRDEESGFNAGSAYVFDVATGQQLLELFPSHATANDHFGTSVSTEDLVVAVGAPNDGLYGAVYLFDATTGEELGRLEPSNPTQNEGFGSSIDIGDGFLVVGSPSSDANGFRSGAAYLFDLDSQAELAQFFPLDTGPNMSFGSTVCVRDGIVLAGARNTASSAGAAYAFHLETLQQLYAFTAADGFDADYFGSSLCASGGRVAISSPNDNGEGEDFGSAYVFEVDCNGTGVADAWELAAGFSSDCNLNLIPDECDIAGGTSPDLDGNGQPDECGPQAGFELYGCGTNPMNSLVVLSGPPKIGSVAVVGIDNPLATQQPLSTPILLLALEPDASFPCGQLLPELGMAGGGALGELLISTAPPNPISQATGFPWLGAGNPSPVAIAIPLHPGLVDVTVYAQGILVDLGNPDGVEFGLTEGAAIDIGL